MVSHAVVDPSLRARSARGFFAPCATQHVRSFVALREAGRALLTLANVVAWVTLLFLA